MAVRAVMRTRGHKLYSQQSFIGSVVMIFTYIARLIVEGGGHFSV